MGRQARGAPRAAAGTPPRARRLGCLHPATRAASQAHEVGRMATYKSSDPLVGCTSGAADEAVVEVMAELLVGAALGSNVGIAVVLVSGPAVDSTIDDVVALTTGPTVAVSAAPAIGTDVAAVVGEDGAVFTSFESVRFDVVWAGSPVGPTRLLRI